MQIKLKNFIIGILIPIFSLYSNLTPANKKDLNKLKKLGVILNANLNNANLNYLNLKKSVMLYSNLNNASLFKN